MNTTRRAIGLHVKRFAPFSGKRAPGIALVIATIAACSGAPDQKPEPAAQPNPGGASAPDAREPQDSGAVAQASGAAGQPATTVAALPWGRPTFCDREGGDPVRDVFCADVQPTIGSLEDFQNIFALNPRAPDPNAPSGMAASAGHLNPANGDIAVLGHSTALAGHVISPINPRVIATGEKAILAYQRGVQQLELAARPRSGGGFKFYLLRFEQACNEREGGCSPGDLFTSKVERDWTRVAIHDDEDLKNTPSDCRQCHRRARESAMLLMRELQSPWTHFFAPITTAPHAEVSGSDLTQDYLNAKGDERYGGLAVDEISALSVVKLQLLVGSPQPLLFDGPQIQSERWPYGPDGYPSMPSPSPTWEAAYAAFKRGDQLALPYDAPRATDADKQAALTLAYQRYRAGEIEADELPDLGNIFPDDPRVRARIGLQTEPDATPQEALIQACAECHNDALDQSISRARFTVAVARLGRAELDLAIARISRPRHAPGAMPPPEARQLDESARDRLLEYLRQAPRADPQLEHAATVGMTLGGGD